MGLPLRTAGQRPANSLALDFSRISDVRDVAMDINKQVQKGNIPPIQNTVINAGFCEFARQTWTEDGFELSFAAS